MKQLLPLIVLTFIAGCASVDYSKPITHVDDFTGKQSRQCILSQHQSFVMTTMNVFQNEIQVKVESDKWLFIQLIQIKGPNGVKEYKLTRGNSQVGEAGTFYLTNEKLLAIIPNAPKIFDGATEWRMMGQNASTQDVITPEFTKCLTQL